MNYSLDGYQLLQHGMIADRPLSRQPLRLLIHSIDAHRNMGSNTKLKPRLRIGQFSPPCQHGRPIALAPLSPLPAGGLAAPEALIRCIKSSSITMKANPIPCQAGVPLPQDQRPFVL